MTRFFSTFSVCLRCLVSFPTRRSSDLVVERLQPDANFASHWCSVIRRPSSVFRRMTEHQWLAKLDRKSTRLNSSHTVISYAVFRFEKKTLQRASRYRQERKRIRQIAYQ